MKKTKKSTYQPRPADECVHPPDVRKYWADLYRKRKDNRNKGGS